MSKVLVGVLVVLVLLGGVVGANWVMRINQRVELVFDYLAAPVAKEEDGKAVSRAELLNRVMIAAVEKEVARIEGEKKNGQHLSLQTPPGRGATVPR